MSTGYKPIDFRGAKSAAQQQFTEESDINRIIKRYRKTGDPTPFLNKRQGVYGDFSGCVDFQTTMERIVQAQEMFMALSPAVRERFGNKVENLIEEIALGHVDIHGMDVKAPKIEDNKGQGGDKPPEVKAVELPGEGSTGK